MFFSGLRGLILRNFCAPLLYLDKNTQEFIGAHLQTPPPPSCAPCELVSPTLIHSRDKTPPSSRPQSHKHRDDEAVRSPAL